MGFQANINAIAGGTIRPNRMVAVDPTDDNQVVECEAGQACHGVCGGNNLDFTSDNHATDGDQVSIQVGNIVYVQTGAAVTAGDPLKSDADGKAITGGGNSNLVALEDSSGDGQIIRAFLTVASEMRLDVEAFTAADTLTKEESGKLVTNLGAAGAVELTLPQDAPAGCYFDVFVAVAQDLRLSPGAAGAIYIGAKGTDNKWASADAIGESVRVVADGNGDWYTVFRNGTWTFES